MLVNSISYIGFGEFDIVFNYYIFRILFHVRSFKIHCKFYKKLIKHKHWPKTKTRERSNSKISKSKVAYIKHNKSRVPTFGWLARCRFTGLSGFTRFGCRSRWLRSYVTILLQCFLIKWKINDLIRILF